MAKLKKWIESRGQKPETEYDDAKREFEMAMGRPFIIVKVEIQEGFEDSRAQFLSLETDRDFHVEVEDLVKKRLTYEKRGVKPTS